MNNLQINEQLVLGKYQIPGVLPHLDNLKTVDYVFKHEFGLNELPLEPGFIIIRGPRQYGKSTWLEQQIALTIEQFGPGTALYLNGDEIANYKELQEIIQNIITLFSPRAQVRRLFIDEISAIENWQTALKRLIDSNELQKVLVITTGSKATDLRRGSEQLPGRKGKLSRSHYLFTPISYAEFKSKTQHTTISDPLFTYLLSGGSPIAINQILTTGQLPEYLVTMINDWIIGEFASHGRSRSHLIAILQSIFRMSCTPIGQAKLARESGLSNNTVAQNYIDLLIDLLTVIPSFPYDPQQKIALFRKPCKYHFTNLLAANCWHPKKPRTVEQLKNLGPDMGSLFEWTVSQEIWRRKCILGDLPEYLTFWQSKDHEIDFVLPNEDNFIEVKSGSHAPTEFLWFPKCFPNKHLTIINKTRFETTHTTGITLEEFLLDDPKT